MKRINVHYQVFLDNPLYLQNARFSHIPWPICTSQYFNHFNSDYLEMDYWNNVSIAADLQMHSSLIDEFDDEDHFRMIIYDTSIHVCGQECIPCHHLGSKLEILLMYFLKMYKHINIICA